MTLNKFWESNEYIAIHCSTKEQADKLCKAFDDMGKTWKHGGRYINTGYDKKHNCYWNTGGLTELNACLTYGVKIVPFEAVDEFKTKKKYCIDKSYALINEIDGLTVEEIKQRITDLIVAIEEGVDGNTASQE